MSVGGALVERCTAMHQETTNQTAAPGSEQRGAEVSGLRLLHRYFFPHHPEKAITLTLYPHVASNYQREKRETGAAEATHCLQCLPSQPIYSEVAPRQPRGRCAAPAHPVPALLGMTTLHKKQSSSWAHCLQNSVLLFRVCHWDRFERNPHM